MVRPCVPGGPFSQQCADPRRSAERRDAPRDAVHRGRSERGAVAARGPAGLRGDRAARRETELVRKVARGGPSEAGVDDRASGDRASSVAFGRADGGIAGQIMRRAGAMASLSNLIRKPLRSQPDGVKAAARQLMTEMKLARASRAAPKAF